MHKWLNWILIFCVISIITVVLFVANEQQKKKILAVPEISIDVKGENAFLTEKELYQRLLRKGYIFKSQTFNELNVNRIENYIKRMTEVLDAKVYANLGNHWNIDVEIRKPIARIFNQYNENFYLDELGHTIQPSYLYTARVVIVNGYIPDKLGVLTVNKIINNKSLITNYSLDDIYRISKYVCNNPFLNHLIGQIYREKTGDFVLIPRVGDQKIVFGKASSFKEVQVKFRKLAEFYKFGLPFEGWNAYSEINLVYDNQIVCTKKEMKI